MLYCVVLTGLLLVEKCHLGNGVQSADGAAVIDFAAIAEIDAALRMCAPLTYVSCRRTGLW